ncbi:hypothetical protein MTO96_038114 [Rhipicephalus appendiculatus]
MSTKAFKSEEHDRFLRRSLGILALLVVLSFVIFVLRPMRSMKGPFSFGANEACLCHWHVCGVCAVPLPLRPSLGGRARGHRLLRRSLRGIFTPTLAADYEEETAQR